MDKTLHKHTKKTAILLKGCSHKENSTTYATSEMKSYLKLASEELLQPRSQAVARILFMATHELV
jgi:hypothetical protein